jgi:hypothetical protein
MLRKPEKGSPMIGSPTSGRTLSRRLLLRGFSLATALFIFLTAPVHAQEHPNLSGTWRLNLATSDYGDLQGPDTRTDVIKQHDGRISESVTAEGRHRRQQYTLDFATDGSQTKLPPGIKMGSVTILSVSACWQGASLVVTQNLRFQGATLVAANTYSLSADGHTLTIALALGGDSETAATFAFDRVDAL